VAPAPGAVPVASQLLGIENSQCGQGRRPNGIERLDGRRRPDSGHVQGDASSAVSDQQGVEFPRQGADQRLVEYPAGVDDHYGPPERAGSQPDAGEDTL